MNMVFFLVGSVPRLAEPHVAVQKQFLFAQMKGYNPVQSLTMETVANVMSVPTGTEPSVISGMVCEVGQS